MAIRHPVKDVALAVTYSQIRCLTLISVKSSLEFADWSRNYADVYRGRAAREAEAMQLVVSHLSGQGQQRMFAKSQAHLLEVMKIDLCFYSLSSRDQQEERCGGCWLVFVQVGQKLELPCLWESPLCC